MTKFRMTGQKRGQSDFLPKLFCGRLSMFSKLCLVALAFTLAACGADFFPIYKRPPTTPDPFSFTTQTGVALNATINSDAITISGLTSASPISINGPVGSNSKYSINDPTAANATATAGTVNNGDKVIVTQTAANALGISTISTLTIGNINGTFTSTTQLVSIPAFATATISGGFTQALSTTLSSVDTLGSHTITIKDSNNSANAQFAITDVNGSITTGFNSALTVTTLNNLRILIRNLQSTTTVTTLTIDGVSTVVNLVP